MHNHNHACFHNIRHCAHCDVAYCTLCNRQWGTPLYPYVSYTPVFGSTMAVSGASTSQFVGNASIASCSHSY